MFVICLSRSCRSADKVTVVLFSASWAEQCTQVRTALAELAKRPATAAFQYVDVPAEELAEISLKHQIEAVPTVLFFRAGKALERVDGVDIGALTAKAGQLAAAAGARSGASGDATLPLEERLKKLINLAKVTVFMKGNREQPRCGFSKELIRILNETTVAYETFDILSDEEVRQGLKTFSDWPTYPQVYVNGDLIGGLDIVKELLAGDELKSTLEA